MGKKDLKDWYKKFFKNSFYNPASPHSIEKALPEVNFILQRTKIKKSAKILDLCCGPGRHSIILAKKGYNVTGVDFSKEYIIEAINKAKKMKLKIKFLCQDARKINFKEEFDLVINLFTSFGYFINPLDDLKVLKNANKALKKNGLLMMDLLNPDFLIKNFRLKNWEILEDGTYHLEKTELKNNNTEAINSWIRIKKGKITKRQFFLRLYNKKRISLILKKANFKPLKFWGNFKGKPLSPKNNRLIVLAKKI